MIIIELRSLLGSSAMRPAFQPVAPLLVLLISEAVRWAQIWGLTGDAPSVCPDSVGPRELLAAFAAREALPVVVQANLSCPQPAPEPAPTPAAESRVPEAKECAPCPPLPPACPAGDDDTLPWWVWLASHLLTAVGGYLVKLWKAHRARVEHHAAPQRRGGGRVVS